MLIYAFTNDESQQKLAHTTLAMFVIALILPVVFHLGYSVFATQSQLGPGPITPGQPQPISDRTTADLQPLSEGRQQKPDEVIPLKSVRGDKQIKVAETGRDRQTQGGQGK